MEASESATERIGFITVVGEVSDLYVLVDCRRWQAEVSVTGTDNPMKGTFDIVSQPLKSSISIYVFIIY